MKNIKLLFFALIFTVLTINAQVDARLMRFPDISATHITFVYAGDIWIVEKQGVLPHA